MCFHFLIYSTYVLNQPDSIEDGIGDPDWRLTIGLIVFWITIFLVVIRGVRSSGKASYFLALFPYVVMIALLIRGATLPGAGEGIRYFFEPQWEELQNPMVREWMIFIDHTKYQRDALNIIYSSNILLYMFRVSSTHLQEEQLFVSSIWYRHSL